MSSITTSSSNTNKWCNKKPSLGLALILACLGFGADRFYVGQMGLGIVLLISYITVFGLIIALPYQFITMISLVIAIFSNRTSAFMYGCHIEFEPPELLDKVIAVVWILVILAVAFSSLILLLR